MNENENTKGENIRRAQMEEKRRKTGEFNPTVRRGGIKTTLRLRAPGSRFCWINQSKSAHCKGAESFHRIVRSCPTFPGERKNYSFARSDLKEPISCSLSQLILFNSYTPSKYYIHSSCELSCRWIIFLLGDCEIPFNRNRTLSR